MTGPFQIAVLHTASIHEDTFAEFVRTISTDHLKLGIESREDGGIYAGLEWLIPTALIVYIGKSYFDSFLSEMGKDHYNLLKTGLKTFREKLLGPSAPQFTMVSSAGKIKSHQPYSLVYSIMAEGRSKLRFKLLIQRDISEREYDEILDAFLGFLMAYHSYAPEAGSIESIDAPKVLGEMVLLAFNLETKALEIIDPIPRMPEN